MRIRRIKLETITNLVEIAALIAAGGYFLYQLGIGWYGVTLSVDIVTQRIHDPINDGQDILGVDVIVTNGVGLLRIYDGLVAIESNGQAETKRLTGIVRYDHQNDLIRHGEPSPENPRTGLGPGEQIRLSTYTRVSSTTVCTIDATVLVKRQLNSSPCEARSATVSLPVK